MKFNLNTCASLYEYNKSCLNKLSLIGHQLEKTYDLKLFCYRRIYSNQKLLYLSAYQDWIDFCFNKQLWFTTEFQKKASGLKEEQRCLVWSGNLKDPVFGPAYEYDIAHGITIYEKHENFIEAFAFGTSRDNVQIYNFYLNNMAYLKRYVAYFKEQAKDLISLARSDTLVSYDFSYDDLFKKEEIPPELSKNLFNVNKYYLSGKYRNIFLTKREAECMYYLARGKTARETGDSLFLSRRTVEKHLENVKIKLNCSNKSHLINLCNNSAIGDLFKYEES